MIRGRDDDGLSTDLIIGEYTESEDKFVSLIETCSDEGSRGSDGDDAVSIVSEDESY